MLTVKNKSRQNGSVIRRLPAAYTPIRSQQPKSENVALPDEYICIKVNSMLNRIRIKDVYLIEGLCDYINIYNKEKRYTIYSTLYGILEKLPPHDFMRVHRSYIVRLDCISMMTSDRISVEMKRIPVSKTYKEELAKRLEVISRIS